MASLEPIDLGNAAILMPFWDFIRTALREGFVSLLPLTASLCVLQKLLFLLER